MATAAKVDNVDVSLASGFVNESSLPSCKYDRGRKSMPGVLWLAETTDP